MLTSTYIAANMVHCFVNTGDESDINGDKRNNSASDDKVVEIRAS